MGPDPDPSWINGANNWLTVNNLLQTADWSPGPDAGPLGEAVYKLLSPGYSSSWETFETTLYTNTDPNNFMSVEYIHNYIHVSYSYSWSPAENMSQSALLGMDWRHQLPNWCGSNDGPFRCGVRPDILVPSLVGYCSLKSCRILTISSNIDRIGAIFQTLNPNMWYHNAANGNRSLTPFHRDAKRTFWTSNECRDWRLLGYDYDDFTVSTDTSSSFGVSLAAIPPALPATRTTAPTTAHETERITAAPPIARDLAAIPATHSTSASATPSGDSIDITALKQTINARYGQIRYALRDSPHIGGRNNDYIINVIYDR
jgi:hypothetical protein